MRMRNLCALIACVLLLALVGPAQAEVRRYALLVGANQGYAHEASLRFAESDVEAVGRTFVEFAGFSSERIVRVVGATAGRARGALLDLNLTIAADVRAGHEAVLFVYYSGHADAQNLHLGGTDLAADELSKMVRGSQARLKILLVDACRSGALTHVKGGRQVAPFRIAVEESLKNEGFATITSSAAGEDAQESDELGSSIFTYHFLAALRGFGDVNGDRVVTLGESYTYAYERSLATSITTVAGSQHATFDYDLRGRADPVLADLRVRGQRAEVVLGIVGEYLFLSPETGALLLEAATRTGRTAVQLPAGRYGVRLRTPTRVFRTELALVSGQSVTVAQADLQPVPLGEVVRKGETSMRLASGPSVFAMMHGPLRSGFTAMRGATLGWAFEWPRVTVLPRLSVATGRATQVPEGSDIRENQLSEMTVEVAGLHVFDLGRVSVAPLVSIGWGVIQQRIDCVRPECSGHARPQALVSTLGVLGSVPLGRGFSVEMSVEAANFYLPRQQKRDGFEGQSQIGGTLTYRAGLGLGWRY